MLDLKKLKGIFVVAIVGILSGALAGCGNGDGDNTGSISGTVYSDEQTPGVLGDDIPLQDALLTAMEGTAEVETALSGSEGSYKIMGLPAGTYSVKASKTGYTEATPLDVSVTAGNNTGGVDFTLQKE